MFKAYKKFWQNYVNFSGRTTRADYWWFTLANTIIWLIWIAVFAGVSVGPIMKYVDHGRFTQADTPMLGLLIVLLLLALFYALATFIPRLSLQYRRIVDTGLSPWWFLLVVIGKFLSVSAAAQNNAITAAVFFLNLAVFVISVSKTDAFKKEK
ncbi:DUF805 domain-containing protein [Fructobacillus evanidus]|uniref:DUF805 family (YhaH) n=1 Tax=Fructobacillus evanidus TaxID=3064281 RepID=A0ABN9YRY4_9LACO|nr:DUF805 family (yhaH) [Fructobacillus sp. LMG 32999]CAK1238271.1 DUF805 family (yhaH) [Fructobacillus sp. LMG 32999]CAK1240562.1 DUF805 family (yhaH) [Fructobacillus sp. LMG 32999]CAK1244126.1 DUF805 family (yhaH) [Fructobacillus sp. LMG 32999]CAK1244465.1 DUF805 family (yhaH) [Fructobacillus sp. LMG 32999]